MAAGASADRRSRSMPRNCGAAPCECARGRCRRRPARRPRARTARSARAGRRCRGRCGRQSRRVRLPTLADGTQPTVDRGRAAASPSPVPAAITPIAPAGPPAPPAAPAPHRLRSTGTAYASASRSLTSDTRGSPRAGDARSRRRARRVRECRDAVDDRPAAPKHAASIDRRIDARVRARTPRSLPAMPENSRVPYVCDCDLLRPCTRNRSNTPSRVVVPPMSPARTFAIDNRIILLHLDAVPPAVAKTFNAEAVCQSFRHTHRIHSRSRDNLSSSPEN